ncbi:MAG: hypothetical protein L0154_14560 [Chloroflexi bacterium]|nr:hypothetical protein [Chloroflexota bacterium]
MLRVKRRYAILVTVLLIAFIISACGGGDEDPTPTSSRNIFPSVTPVNTAIGQVESPTPLPTFSGGSFPSSTPFRFPTVGAAPTLPSRLPDNIQINSPVSGGILTGAVTIFGSASHPDFVQYALEYGPQNNPSNLWYPITPQAVTVPVINGALGAWNTTLVPDGVYQIRLHVYLTGGREVTNAIVSNMTVRNSVPSATPQATNNPPTIGAIAPFRMIAGTSATLAIGIFDRDGDSVTFSTFTDNTNVVTVSPAGQAISVNALNPGVATVTVRATDSRNASSQTSFIVTVERPPSTNNPPNIAAIPAQTLQQNTTINVPIVLSDPDGDEVSFTVSSANSNIASAVASNVNDSINLTGTGQGSTTISVTAEDSRGLTRTAVFSVVVNPRVPDNNPPSIGAISGQNVNVGQTRQVTLSTSDPDGDSLNITASSNNTNIVRIASVSANVVQIRGVNAGSASVTVVVTDGRGGTANTTFSVSVSAPPPPNQNPTIAPISNKTLELGQTINVDVVVSDPDGDDLTIASNSNSAEIAATSLVDADTILVTATERTGTADITVVVADGKGGSATTSFSVTVNQASQPNRNPTIGQVADVAVNVGTTINVPLNVSDPDGDSVSLTASTSASNVATVLVGDGNTLTVGGAGTGTATITVSANDGRGGTATMSFSVTVSQAATTAPSNRPPTIEDVGPQSVDVGQSRPVVLTINDPDGDELTVATNANPEGVVDLSFNENTNTLTITGSTAGTANVTVTVSDPSGGTDSTTFDVTVSEPAPANTPPTIEDVGPQSLDVGQSVGIVLTINDADGDPLTVTPTAASGGVVNLSYDEATSTLTITGSAEGTTNVTVEVSDPDGASDSTTFAVTVSQPAPTNNPPTIADVLPQSVEVGQSISVSLTINDLDNDPLTVVPTAASGDLVDLSFDANTSTLSITGAAAGTTNVTVEVSDPSGASDSTTFAVTVSAPAPVNNPPTIGNVGAQAVEAGSSVDVTLTVDDPDGDAITVAASAEPQGIVNFGYDEATTTLTINGLAEGTATVTVTVNDTGGLTASTSFPVTVSAPVPVNNPPTIEAVGAQSVDVNQSIEVALTIGDPDGDPLTVTPSADPEGLVTLSFSAETNTLTITGVAEGTPTVTVTVSDPSGEQASTSFPVTVSAPVGPPTDTPAPVFDITQIDELPDITALMPTLQPIFNAGVQAGNRANVVAFAGDDLVNNGSEQPNPLSPIAEGTYDLGDNTNLQGITDYFTVEAAHIGVDGSSTSFGVNSAAVGDGWNPATLLNANATDAPFCQQGESPLACELRVAQPAWMIVGFIPANATTLDPTQFRNNLQTVVDTIIENGTIPVLVTLPNDGSVDPGTLAQYNQAIVEIADERGIPVYNWYVTVSNIDPYSVGGTGSTDFTAGALNSGINRRNLAILRVLNRLRSNLTP